MFLAAALAVLSMFSLFVGVIDITPSELFSGNPEQAEIFLISRLPRLLGIICTGVGMSVAGLIMQQLFFGLEDKVDGLMADFDSRISKLAEFASGKTAIVGLCTSGSFNVMGNDGRCSIIGKEIGFSNLGAGETTSTHGNETSFGTIVEKNPDYVFVMDRDAAIGTEGSQLARDIVENELIMGADAYKNGHIVYLEHPAVWYTAEGGINALNIMLEDLETVLPAE